MLGTLAGVVDEESRRGEVEVEKWEGGSSTGGGWKVNVGGLPLPNVEIGEPNMQ